MPGVSITDAEQIFTLVKSKRTWVAASVVTQLISAVFYDEVRFHYALQRATLAQFASQSRENAPCKARTERVFLT